MRPEKMLESSRELRVGVVGIGARCYLAALADSSPVPAPRRAGAIGRAGGWGIVFFAGFVWGGGG